MVGKEGQKLQNVAAISFQRFRRIATLVAQVPQPAFDFGGDFGCQEVHHFYFPPRTAGEGTARRAVEGASAAEQALRPRPLPPRCARSPFPASRGRIEAPPFPLPKPTGIGTTCA